MAERVRGPRGIVGARTRLVERGVRVLQPKLREYFLGFETRLASNLKQTFLVPGVKGWDDVNWREERKRLTQILVPHYEMIGEETFRVVSAQVGAEIEWNLSRPNIRAVTKDLATRIVGITNESRDRVREMVVREIRDGSNADKLEANLRAMVRSWAGLRGPVERGREQSDGSIDRRKLTAAEAAARSRAHSIALTETGNAFNRSAVLGYMESGLVTQVIVYDGDDCGWESHDDPDLANRSTRSLTEALANPLSHPHCQRAFGPQVQRTRR